MIKMIRIDSRLLHGQTAVAWTHELQADAILIANDQVSRDEMRKSLFKMAKPNGVKLVIKSIDDAAKAINSGVTDKYKLFIIVETVSDFYKLNSLCNGKFHSVDIGGAPQRTGTKNYDKAVNLTDDEVKMLKTLNQQGIDVYVQMVPNDSKISFDRLVK